MKKKSRERFEEIVKVFAKYGFGYVVDSTINNNKNSPKNFRKAIEELGPTFVKIGQILSTRDDILPKEYIDELVKLQDSVFIQEISVIKEVFEDSVGKKIEDSFNFEMKVARKVLAIKRLNIQKMNEFWFYAYFLRDISFFDSNKFTI